MSDRYKGAILSPTAPTVTPQSAGGIYTSSQQLQYQGQGVWPSAINYPINNSLRFRSSASAYLNRTPASTGNRQIWTWSAWVKRGELNPGVSFKSLFGAGISGSDRSELFFYDDKISVTNVISGVDYNLNSTAVFRDTGAWYHVVLSTDTTQSTAANRVKIYINNANLAISGSYPTQNVNLAVNNTVVHYIGENGGFGRYFDGYMTEINFIDGQALTPSSFGTTDAYGIWQPIPYTGAYGTNGFYLPFRLNSTSSFYGSFNGSSQYLSTTSGITNQFTPTSGFTLEMWLNPSNTNTAQVFYVGGGSNNWNTTNGLLFGLLLGSGGNYQWQWNNAGSTFTLSFPDLPTNQWSHVAIGYNGTTTRIWVNGVSAGTSTNPYTVPTTVNQYVIGSNFGGAANFYSGQLSNLRFVKGTDVYGVANANISVPISPLTAIANTQLLTLQNSTIIDNSTNAFSITNNGSVTTTATTNIFALPTISSDYSGNNNNWTPNNISLTPGSTYDSMKDVPTNTNSNTANYCVLNSIGGFAQNGTGVSNANLTANTDSGFPGTFAVSSGKWYWEVTYDSRTAPAYLQVGIFNTASTYSSALNRGTGSGSYVYNGDNGNKRNNNSSSAYGASYTTGDVIGVALDMDAGTVVFYKNNSSQGTAFSGLSGAFTPDVGSSGEKSTFSINFGQRPFSYTPPSGFYPLNTYNLPTPTILAGNQYFDAVTRNGFGSSGGSVTSLNFQPDFWWEKARNTVSNHTLIDSIRGVTKELYSNLTNAESTGSNFLVSFNSNGFTMGSNDWGTSTTLVDWVWKAGGSGGVSNTQGTITSTVSANTTAGFSIVTYTGTGANATVGHGLGVAPKWVIVKGRNVGSTNWFIYTETQGATKYLDFSNGTGGTDTSAWNSTAPTSTVFSVGTSYYTNYSATTYVAYCFAQVAGYSAFGSYTGNGSTDGVFIYTGFRPKYVLVKRTSNTEAWTVRDSARNPTNVATLELQLNSSAAEGAAGGLDLLSNGFKCRAANSEINANADTYIYMAFAENPFKIARAR